MQWLGDKLVAEKEAGRGSSSSATTRASWSGCATAWCGWAARAGPTPMSDLAVPTARELRAEIRDWRRGRAQLKWGEVLSDAYVALFCVIMVAAMGGNGCSRASPGASTCGRSRHCR